MSESVNMRSFEGETILGKYRLLKYLNEGGFGAVFSGSHRAYKLPLREVAIKVGKRPMQDEEARTLFRDALAVVEVTEAAPDEHLRERFVRVYDAGRCPEGGPLAGHPYVVMELVGGGSIRTCLRAGPLTLTRADAYFVQMLEAVAFMHRGLGLADGTGRAIIHRDIKPDNVLVDRRDQGGDVVKMTDFGLAVKVDSLLGWTQSGGDLAYLPPESFSHDICSPQSDIYMLALVFYEMITGRSPFAQVGSHLQGTDEEKRDELRKLHLAAREKETFPFLGQHPEMKRRPAMKSVILRALAFEDDARTVNRPGEPNDAQDLLEAWTRAKKEGMPPPREEPWEMVKRLTTAAEREFAALKSEAGMRLLEQAMRANRDQVSDPMAVGRTYLLMVTELLRQGDLDGAKQAASEGYRRRRCCSTCKAMAAYVRTTNARLAIRYDSEARNCEDQE